MIFFSKKKVPPRLLIAGRKRDTFSNAGNVALGPLDENAVILGDGTSFPTKVTASVTFTTGFLA
jgi:hypothetical protein